jgi:hypothetical protein
VDHGEPAPLYPYYSIAASANYGSLAEMNAVVPPNSVGTFAISGGTLGTQTANVYGPAVDLFPEEIPYLTGNSYDLLQGMDPSKPLTLTVNGFQAIDGVDYSQSYASIYRVSDGYAFGGISGDNTQTEAVIPANTLQPNTTYDFVLTYLSRLSTPNAGFDGATAEIGFGKQTHVIFTTVPEPSTCLLLGIGALIVGCWRLWRR